MKKHKKTASIKDQMSKILNKVVNSGSVDLEEGELFKNEHHKTFDFSDMSDLKSISYSTRKDQYQIGSASFVSNTKRIEHKSNVPGPGTYTSGVENRVSQSKFNVFGSTSERKTELNRSVNLPFTTPTNVENPPVGFYDRPKIIKQSKFLK